MIHKETKVANKNQPITKTQAEEVLMMMEHPGWKVFIAYLTKQHESYKLQLEQITEDFRYKQGQISIYSEIFNKIKEYDTIAKK